MMMMMMTTTMRMTMMLLTKAGERNNRHTGKEIPLIWKLGKTWRMQKRYEDKYQIYTRYISS